MNVLSVCSDSTIADFFVVRLLCYYRSSEPQKLSNPRGKSPLSHIKMIPSLIYFPLNYGYFKPIMICYYFLANFPQYEAIYLDSFSQFIFQNYIKELKISDLPIEDPK